MSDVAEIVVDNDQEVQPANDDLQDEGFVPKPQAKPANELISVVIPVASWDKEWRNLLQDLARLPEGTEVIFSVSEKDTSFSELPNIVDNLAGKRVKWVRSPSGRAKCLNTGADAATSKYIWFLHADSRFPITSYQALEKIVKKRPECLYYFNLRFLTDGPNLMIINEIGARIRSRLFGSPFGDQGLCIKKDVFADIGGFPEEAEYGEDHLFVWYAKQSGVRLCCTGATLLTSSRKYKKNGWLNITMRHLSLWFRQAWPEWKKLMKSAR